ncbi:hypothetical protein [Streptomyces prunicolor]|uniref:hypothetical protein n=1 Tax=Streptomyces prunicolor TaxID=67348 RepID=UPI0033D3117C
MHDYLVRPRVVESGLIQPGDFGRVDLGLYPFAGHEPAVTVAYEPHSDLVVGSLLREPHDDMVRLVLAVQNFGDVPCHVRVTVSGQEPSDLAPPPA